MKIIVWGLGNIGRKWLETMILHQKDIDAEIVAVVDSDDNIRLNEVERELFVEKSKIGTINCDYVVVTSDRYFDDITKELINEFCYEKDKIVRYNEFYKVLPGKYHCNMCNADLAYWEELGEENELFQQKKVIGGGRRKGLCPICHAMDRTRYEYYILQQYTDIFNQKRILHFAPEADLKKKIAESSANYITADIQVGRADVVADITNLNFEDEFFDFIICNHVLEHISDEKAAFSEVRRCLKRNGKFVVTVPICWEQKTFEDSGISTPEERQQFYGQADHVRLYGNDIQERFEKYGLVVESYKSDELLSDEAIGKYGFIKGDTVFICTKID